MLKKVVTYYLKKPKDVKNEFLVMKWNCIIFLNITLNLKESKTLSKTHIFSKMINKKTCHVLGQL
jgi:hypothetical protein